MTLRPSLDGLAESLRLYSVAVEAERAATNELEMRRAARDEAERVARHCAQAADAARDALWSQVEALAGERSRLWLLLEHSRIEKA